MIGEHVIIGGKDRASGCELRVNGIIRAEDERCVIVEFIDGADDGLFIVLEKSMRRERLPDSALRLPPSDLQP